MLYNPQESLEKVALGALDLTSTLAPGAQEQPLPLPTHDLQPQAQAGWRQQQPAREELEHTGCTAPWKPP